MEVPYLRGQADLLIELQLTLDVIPNSGGQRTLRNALRAWAEKVRAEIGDRYSPEYRYAPDDKVTFTTVDSLLTKPLRVRGIVVRAVDSNHVRGYVVLSETERTHRWMPEVDLEPAR